MEKNEVLQPKDRVSEWIRKQDPDICCLQETHFRLKDTQTKRKEMGKDTALMGLEGMALNKMGQREKDKYRLISRTRGI